MHIDADARIPLNVGTLLSDTFSAYLANIVTLFSVAFIPLALWNVAVEKLLPALIENGVDVSVESLVNPFAAFTPAVILFAIVTILLTLIISSVLTLSAYDLALGRPTAITAYLNRTLRNLLPIIVLGVIYYVACLLGFLLLVLPGLYVAAVLWVFLPVILVENAGWRAFRRAAKLSQGYRWPIIACMLIIFVMLIIFASVLEALQLFAIGTGMNILLILPVEAISDAISTGLLAMFTARLYARLREIKEGLGMDELFEVFE